MAQRKKETEQRTFEECLRRLEEIVEQLERGDVPLDESIHLYEEGIGLSTICAERLTNAELSLKRLGKDLEGKFQLLDENLEE